MRKMKREKGEKKREKRLEDLGKILRKLGQREKGFLVEFFPGSSTRGADALLAVKMSKRVDWQDRGRPGIPDEVADHGVVAVLGDTTR
jgi:hypothetical protein